MSKKLKTKKFVYEIVVEGVPYNEETATAVYGANAFNSDFSVDSFVRDHLSDIFQDALVQRLWHQMQAETKPVGTKAHQKRYKKYLADAEKRLNEIRNTVKLVRVE
jgi:hypothetical protein